MGWRSDGVAAATQRASWPAQLARLAGRELPQPYIGGAGCRSPLRAPLTAGTRISGEAAGALPETLACAPLRDGVTLPARNLAVSGATTYDALVTTPEAATGSAQRLYARVLPPSRSQVEAVEALRPGLVSVELGSNEVLRALSGVALPYVTIFPAALWEPLYAQLLDRVQAASGRVVLVGLIDDAAELPALRRGGELWDDRAAFADRHVAVSPDCEGSGNLLFVPALVPAAVAGGAQRLAQGLGAHALSCAGAPATAPDSVDFVLDPAETALVNAQLAAMNAFIAEQAAARGFAHFELEALYGRAGLKPPFSVAALMTSATPFGPLVSLDGVHPSSRGSLVLADAAAAALNVRYGMGVRRVVPPGVRPRQRSAPRIAADARRDGKGD